MTSLTEAEQRILSWRMDFEKFCRERLKVRTKSGDLVPFVLNAAQRELHAHLENQRHLHGWVRAIVLKGRQQGVSTYVAARYYWKAVLWAGRNVYILSHEQTSSDTLFGMVDRFHKNDPVAPHIGVANAKELEFDKLDSSYAVATAGQKAGGRGKAISLFHGCLSPDTWIMDPAGGVRRMGEFRVGDVVLTHTGEVAPISFISRKKSAAFAVSIMGANEPLIATQEHRFITRRGKVALGALRVGDELMHPVAALRAGGDFLMGRALGLYLAEGHQRRNRVTFVVHENEVARTLEWVAPLVALCKSGPKIRRRKSKAVAVELDSQKLAAFVLEQCGRTKGKRLPPSLKREFVRGIVVGYFAGDGGGQFDKTTRRVQAPSVLSGIAFGMRDALAALGYGWASVVRREGARRHGRNEQTQWIVRLSGVGADALWADIGRQAVSRSRKARAGNFAVEGAAAWFPIRSITPVGEVEVMDFEVAHGDHSYRTWQCATSNSEVAFWANAKDHFAASVQGVPLAANTEIILESTSAGPSGEFYEKCQTAQQGLGDYQMVFLRWTMQQEYSRTPEPGFALMKEKENADDALSEAEYAELHGVSLPQMAWRRGKILEMRDPGKFRYEYPLDFDEAFSDTEGEPSYLSPAAVLRARKRRIVGAGPLIVGVDPAGAGGDRFAMTWRRGHQIIKTTFRKKVAHLEAVQWCKDVIDTDKPARMNIDMGNIGSAIVSTLKAMGPKYAEGVRGINFGGTSQFKNARPKVPGPKNRRAEMYQRMKEWFADEVAIPDMAELQSDLCAPRLKPMPNNDFLLESKKDMKTRGLPSCDLADSAALTFASIEFFEKWEERGGVSVEVPVEKQTDEAYLRGEFGGGGGWMAG